MVSGNFFNCSFISRIIGFFNDKSRISFGKTIVINFATLIGVGYYFNIAHWYFVQSFNITLSKLEQKYLIKYKYPKSVLQRYFN